MKMRSFLLYASDRFSLNYSLKPQRRISLQPMGSFISKSMVFQWETVITGCFSTIWRKKKLGYGVLFFMPGTLITHMPKERRMEKTNCTTPSTPFTPTLDSQSRRAFRSFWTLIFSEMLMVHSLSKLCGINQIAQALIIG